MADINWEQGTPFIYAPNYDPQSHEGEPHPRGSGMTDPEWDGKTVLAAWLVTADVAGGSFYVRLHAKVEKGRVVLYSSRVKEGARTA